MIWDEELETWVHTGDQPIDLQAYVDEREEEYLYKIRIHQYNFDPKELIEGLTDTKHTALVRWIANHPVQNQGVA